MTGLSLSPIHVIGIVAALALLYQSLRLVRDRKEGIFEFLLWTGFGLVLLAVSIGSAITTIDVLAVVESALGTLGFNVGRDSVFFVSNLVLFFLVFYTYIQLVESRKQLSDLNQEIALLRYELEQSQDDD